MYLIVGIGNPGMEYDHTRHNMGFDVIDKVIKKYGLSMKEKFNGEFCILKRDNFEAILLKPLTYVNLSGECIQTFKKYFNIPNQNIIVIYDDVDLNPRKY